VSLYKMDGAREDVLKWGSHAPPKHVMGLYTAVEWKCLCAEVAKLQLTPRLLLDSRKPPVTVAFRRPTRYPGAGPAGTNGGPGARCGKYL
jgi:hypothetical protein